MRGVNKFMLGGLYFSWGIPVVVFMINPSYSPQTWPVWCATGMTLLIALVDHRFLALSIPFVAMFSPLATFGRVMDLLPSEILLAYCALFWLAVVLMGRGRIRLLPGDGYLIGLVFVTILSYILSFEHKALLPSLLNWGALITVFIVTRMTLRTAGLISVYFLSLLVVATYIAALVVSGFINGMQLVLMMEEAEADFLDRESVSYLFRASYFYANVFYVLGAAAIIAFVAIFSKKKAIYKYVSIGVLAAILSTLFVMFSKTALVALTLCLLIWNFLAFSTRTSTNESRPGRTTLLFGFMFVLLWIVILRIADTSDYYQLETDSLKLRMTVISSSFEVLLQYPERIIFGFGPDASIRVSNTVTEAARWSGVGTEGAIDSAYMTFLFEYGLMFIALFLLFGVHALVRLFRRIKQSPQLQPVFITLFLVLVFVYISAITQVIGTSKVAWVIVQIFALTGICLSRNTNELSHVRVQDAPFLTETRA